MRVTLILDGKRVCSREFDKDTSEDKIMEFARQVVRKYDGYPFLQTKNTTHGDKLIIDLHTFNHTSSVLEFDYNG